MYRLMILVIGWDLESRDYPAGATNANPERNHTAGCQTRLKNKNNLPAPLAEKQLWRIGDRYLQISELGKLLAHYKMMNKPGRAGVWTQSTTRVKLAEYLRLHSAVLVTSATI